MADKAEEYGYNAGLLQQGEQQKSQKCRWITVLVLLVVAAGAAAVGVLKPWESAAAATTEAPTMAPTTASPTVSPTPRPIPCLCVFDVDRTLTGAQGETGLQCPKNKVIAGVEDQAYKGGTLTMGEFGQAINETFCGKCFMGLVSAGSVSGTGSAERREMMKFLNKTGMLMSDVWNPANSNPPISPLVPNWQDGTKQNAVKAIIQWHSTHVGVAIADKDVHFFDDRESNVSPFKSTNYNARQISCGTRDTDPAIGLCGATLAEIVTTLGVELCPK